MPNPRQIPLMYHLSIGKMPRQRRHDLVRVVLQQLHSDRYKINLVLVRVLFHAAVLNSCSIRRAWPQLSPVLHLNMVDNSPTSL